MFRIIVTSLLICLSVVSGPSLFEASPAIADTGEQTLHAMINHNWVAGHGFPIETQVDVAINGGDKADFNITTDSNGHFSAEGWTYWPGQQIARGDAIDVSYNGQTVSMVVQNINAEVDLPNNRIVGTAFTPEGIPLDGRRVEVDISEDFENYLYHYEGIVDEFGAFELGGDPEEFTILKGHKLFLSVHDSPDGTPAGHVTSMEPYNELLLIGDLNGDGVVDLADAILALQVLAGCDVAEIFPEANVNSDGKIGIEEAVYIMQKVSGIRD